MAANRLVVQRRTFAKGFTRNFSVFLDEAKPSGRSQPGRCTNATIRASFGFTNGFCLTHSFSRNLVCVFTHQKIVAGFTAHGVLRLNCRAASTTVPAMKKSIILVSALSVVVMALVSCASDSDVDPMRVRADTTGPTQGPAPAHESHITGM
jgi:hypothetical protein